MKDPSYSFGSHKNIEFEEVNTENDGFFYNF